MHGEVGGYRPSDIKVVAAWDVDRRKVGKDVAEAIFAKPNCTEVFCENVPASGAMVRMGRKLDGIADHMADYPEDRTFMLADEAEPDLADVVRVLKETRTDILVNYLPVGSQEASEFYAECALEAGSRSSIASRCLSPAIPPGRSGFASAESRSSATTSRLSWERRSSIGC